MFEWSEERVTGLLEAAIPEGQTIELKAELPTRNDRGRAELLKDVSAFANASGGTLIYGVSEKNGAACALAGLQIDNPDEEIRRLSQTIDSGIEPRLSGVRFTALELDKGKVLVLDVPESFDGPHRYNFNGHSKFVQRNGVHTAELSYDQLRSAFNRSAQRLEHLRAQWADAFSLDHLWKPLRRGPVAVLRVAPLLSADNRQMIDPRTATENWSDLIHNGWGGGSPIYNYEGLAIAASRNDDEVSAYTQVHRIGAVTSYSVVGRDWDGASLFFAGAAERFFLETAQKAFEFLVKQRIVGSAVVHAGVACLASHYLVCNDRYGSHSRVLSQLDRLELPEFIIDNIENPGDIVRLMRPGFDLIWQAFGHAGCPNIRPDGTWWLDN